jgi:hypothetical protein
MQTAGGTVLRQKCVKISLLRKDTHFLAIQSKKQIIMFFFALSPKKLVPDCFFAEIFLAE